MSNAFVIFFFKFDTKHAYEIQWYGYKLAHKINRGSFMGFPLLIPATAFMPKMNELRSHMIILQILFPKSLQNELQTNFSL